MNRHRSRAEFHLACPYTSQPICRCRLYIRAEPMRPPVQRPTCEDDHVESVRQNLLGAIVKAGSQRRYRETHSDLSPSFVRAVHRRSLGISSSNIDTGNNNVQRLMAAVVDAAEISREDAQVRAKLAAAEAAEARRIEEVRRLREEALRLAKPEVPMEEEEPIPVAQPVVVPSRNSGNSKLSHLSAEEEARQEELKEIEREKARIRKRERDRERRRLKKLQREKDLEAKRRRSNSRKR